MIGWTDLHARGAQAILDDTSSETALRRGVSALYYEVFHHLTAAGCAVFRSGGAALQAQAARAYGHGPMRKLCERYARSPDAPFPQALDRLNQPAPDPRLRDVAATFAGLQEARHAADYDVHARFAIEEARELLRRAVTAHDALDAIQHQPATIVFLTALLLDDRWTRRG